jgi:hypothetical protein
MRAAVHHDLSFCRINSGSFFPTQFGLNSQPMPTMLEVEPEVASKVQARAREPGVSVDVYLPER